MTNAEHLFVPIATKRLASGTDDDDLVNHQPQYVLWIQDEEEQSLKLVLEQQRV